MPKVNYRTKEIVVRKKKDIEFKFSDVQTRNPRLQGKTPVEMYIEDLSKGHIAKKNGGIDEVLL